MKKPLIELIHPPHLAAIEDRLDAPLGLLYIASNLKSNGFEVSINDLSGHPPEKWQIGFADIYGITSYAPTISTSEAIAKKCKEKNSCAKVGTGGAHPTHAPESIPSIFDFIVIGEGEEAFLEAVRDYPNTKRLYKKTLERDLDLYPNPDYSLVDLNSYKRQFGGENAITILTSRGCPYRCSFCGLAEHHKILKYRSPEKVAEEIVEIQKKYGKNKFNFQDDTFTTWKSRLYRMLELFEPLGIGFRFHGRAGLDKPEDYFKAKKAGAEVVAWGIESGSQEMLNSMNKQVTVKQNKEVIKWAKDAGLTTRAFFVFGFPGETRKTMEQTMEFIEETNPDQIFVSNFVPYPGTEVWLHPEKYGVTKIYTDFANYFQVDKTGRGSRNIEVANITTNEFFELESEFRKWVASKEKRGSIQEYEIQLQNQVQPFKERHPAK